VQALQLPEAMDDGAVRGSHRVEEVPGDEHDVGRARDDIVHGASERVGHIGFSLIDTS
jgi:hypothetical protein